MPRCHFGWTRAKICFRRSCQLRPESSSTNLKFQHSYIGPPSPARHSSLLNPELEIAQNASTGTHESIHSSPDYQWSRRKLIDIAVAAAAIDESETANEDPLLDSRAQTSATSRQTAHGFQ